MELNTSQSRIVVVRDRPWLVPGLGLLFSAVGLISAVSHSIQGAWDRNDVVGVVLSLGFGGFLFLYTARHSTFVFDGRQHEFRWSQRSVLARSHGSMPLGEIQSVIVQRGPDVDDQLTRVLLRTAQRDIPLSVGFSTGEERHRTVANAIREVLAASGGSPR